MENKLSDKLLKLAASLRKVLAVQGYGFGDRVSWNYGATAFDQGTVQAVYTKKITVKIAKSKITKVGTKENPALLIKSDTGQTFLKLSSEVQPSI